jgi:hypothetical protein
MDIEAALGINRRRFHAVRIKDRWRGVSLGLHRETAIWLATRPKQRFMWRGHDALFISAGRLRVRVMKPRWLS